MMSDPFSPRPVVSAVMPCLNEARTLPVCIRKAQASFAALGLPGEVVVADNGSSDDSVAIAQALGARVVHQPSRDMARLCQRAFGPRGGASSSWEIRTTLMIGHA